MGIADLMEQLLEAGAPMEAVIIAVRAVEAKDAELAERKTNDRDRKRRQRARGRDEDGTVTGQSRDEDGTVTDTPLSRPPMKLILTPPPIPPKQNPAHVREPAWRRISRSPAIGGNGQKTKSAGPMRRWTRKPPSSPTFGTPRPGRTQSSSIGRAHGGTGSGEAIGKRLV